MFAASYTLSSTTALPFPEAVERVRSELKEAGFGVLCEIDVQATLGEKLGVERQPYLILGACNPRSRIRPSRPSPTWARCCPATWSSISRERSTRIAAVDPERMLSIVDNDVLAPVAAEVKARLAGVVERAAA